MFGAETDFEVLKELSSFFIDVGAQCDSGATLDRAALGEDGSEVDVIGVDLEWLLTLTVVDAIHGH